MRHVFAPLLMIALAAPAMADLRPKARPDVITAFAGASDLALRVSPRPVRSPDIVGESAAPAIVASSAFVTRYLELEPFADLAPKVVVTVSTSNAPIMPDAAAAVRAAFVAGPGPALRPRTRPGVAEVTPVALTIAPRLRPAARPVVVAPDPVASQPAAAVRLALVTPRPVKRPAGLLERARKAPEVEPDAVIVKTAAIRVNPGEALVKPKKGSVCGDPRIRGETLAPIPAKVKGCGIAEPVRVNEVDGVRLSPGATMDCTTAKALKSWVANGLKPAVGKRGVAELKVAASYACRSRNNIKGARISEHGRGKAIDIAAIVLGNGQVIDVLRDYRRDTGKFLRAAHKSACGVFGTTLGPGSDGYHENHLHFDTASHRGGPYCR